MRKLEREMCRCPDPERWIGFNDEFHLLLYQEGGAVRLSKVISTLRNWVAVYIRNMVRTIQGGRGRIRITSNRR